MGIKSFRIQFYLLITFLFIGCGRSNEDCYRMKLGSISNPSVLTEESPIIFEGAIIGYVEDIEIVEGNSIAKFCLPKAIELPNDYELHYGFIKAFGINGVKIETDNLSGNNNNSEGVRKDSIELIFSSADSALTNRLIEIVSEINEKHKQRKDTLSKD